MVRFGLVFNQLSKPLTQLNQPLIQLIQPINHLNQPIIQLNQQINLRVSLRRTGFRLRVDSRMLVQVHAATNQHIQQLN